MTTYKDQAAKIKDFGMYANYCRDPDGTGTPWCYTSTDAKELCGPLTYSNQSILLINFLKEIQMSLLLSYLHKSPRQAQTRIFF